MSKKLSIQVWVEGTIVAAMAMALSYIPIEIANSGIDLSLGLVPIILYAYRRGAYAGISAGFLWGLLNIVLGSAMKNFVSVSQILMEYPFAFAFSGIAGIFSHRIQEGLKQNHLKKVLTFVILGSVLSVVSRWFWHFWAGVFVWGIYAPKGMSPYLYSFTLNGTSALINSVYAGVVLTLLLKTTPSLFVPKKNYFVS